MLCLVVSNCNPMDCSLPGSSVHGDSPARILEWVAKPSSMGSSQTRDQTQVSCTAGRFFMSEPPGKPKNTGVGNLSLQGIFPTQESNWGLLNCRQILYQLRYQGSLIFELYFQSIAKFQRLYHTSVSQDCSFIHFYYHCPP